MNNKFLVLYVSISMISVCGCGVATTPLPTVNQVELDRYLGKWYEIAKYPNPFQSGCVAATAEYELRDDGSIRVYNTCREGDLNGAVRDIEGSARIVDQETNAKLKVSFFLPIFEGDYWILELGDADDYGYVVVGEPTRRTLWILSRTPQLDQTIIDDIVEHLPTLGYDPDQLEMSTQPDVTP